MSREAFNNIKLSDSRPPWKEGNLLFKKELDGYADEFKTLAPQEPETEQARTIGMMTMFAICEAYDYLKERVPLSPNSSREKFDEEMYREDSHRQNILAHLHALKTAMRLERLGIPFKGVATR